MRTGFLSSLLIALAVGLLFVPVLRGQDADGAKAPTGADADKEANADEAEPAKRRSDGDAKSKSKSKEAKSKESDISEEDRERMRRLLRQVWDDPAVVQSRDEVRVASDNLRRVLGEKMRQIDPEAAEFLSKMRKDSRFSGGSPGEGRGSGGPGGRKSYHSASGQAGLDFMARPPFYAAFSKEQKEIYDAAFKKALGSDELEGVVASFEGLRKQDDELRKKRTQQFMRARKIIFSTMIKADPRVQDLIPKHEEGERREGGARPPKPE